MAMDSEACKNVLLNLAVHAIKQVKMTLTTPGPGRRCCNFRIIGEIWRPIPPADIPAPTLADVNLTATPAGYMRRTLYHVENRDTMFCRL